MNESELRDLLVLTDGPAPASSTLTDRVAAAMLAELDERAETAPSPVRERRSWFPGIGRALRPRPGFAFAVVALFAVLAVLGASLVLDVRNAPTALAELQQARRQFARLSAYHATTEVRANDRADDPDFETEWATEDWYQDADTWRTAVTSSNGTGSMRVGDFDVVSGGLYGQYAADSNVFTVTPVGERDQPPMNPSQFFDPSLQWWSTGDEGDPGKPSDAFFRDDCSASSSRYLERTTTTLRCDAKPRDIELVLDDQTGMLLSISVFDISRTVTSIEFEPAVPDGLFSVTAPEGAKRRWGGTSEPPAEYQVALGADVSARYQIVDGPTAGLAVAAVDASGVWTVPIRCGQETGCRHQLVRVDPRTGRVRATFDPPGHSFIDGVAFVGDEMWLGFTELGPDGRSSVRGYVQRYDVAANALAGAPIETSDSGGRLVATGTDIWSTGGAGRDVTVGPAQTTYRSLARIDTVSGNVTQIELDGGAAGAPVVANGKVWVGTEKINARDPYTSDYAIVGIDIATNRVTTRIPTPEAAQSLVAVEHRLYASFVSMQRGSQRWSVGVAETAAAGAPSFDHHSIPGSELGSMVIVRGTAWMTSFLRDEVVKVDLASFQVAGTIATGRGPSGIAYGLGSIWVANANDGTLVRIDVE